MKARMMVGVGLVAVLVVGGVMLLGPGSAQATDCPAPERVVSDFYDAYLDLTGEGEERRNPLVERAYRSSEHLSADFVAEVDALLDSFERGGYDPFLLAQDIPVAVEIGRVATGDDEAEVMVELFWGGNPVPGKRLVILALTGDGWKIESVEMAEK